MPPPPHLVHNLTVLTLLIDTEKLEELLNERRMTRKELAVKTGLSKSFINYLANGERNPGRATAEILARALDVPVGRFVTERWVPRPRRSSPTQEAV